jgi:predicted PurR-regulated permease PerM
VSDINKKDSPSWQPSTKAIVLATLLVLLGALIVRFQFVLGMLVLAIIISFLIVPLVNWIQRRARLSWVASTNIAFIFLILFVLTASTAVGLAIVQQLQALIETTQDVLADLPGQVDPLEEQLFQIGPWTIDIAEFDIGALLEQALSYVEPVFNRASSLITGLATVAVETIIRVLFVLVVAYFITLDNVRFRKMWSGFKIPGYEYDFDRLRSALGNLWNSFLRGQLLVVTVTGILTWILMSVLGLRFSLGLGVLGGIAKFVPIVGPTAAGALAAIVALFQPSNWFGLSPVAHVVVVVISVIILDQGIDYLVIPRIMGTRLNLHPVIVIIAALIGATLAGVLGLLLSAPATATLILVGRYIYRKLIDQSPWEPPIDMLREAKERSLLSIFRRKKPKLDKEGESK